MLFFHLFDFILFLQISQIAPIIFRSAIYENCKAIVHKPTTVTTSYHFESIVYMQNAKQVQKVATK